MRFTKIYEELKFFDVFTPASKEEVKERQKTYVEMKLKEALDLVEKTKLPDGSWHIHDSLELRYCSLSSLEDINVSIVDDDFDVEYNYLTSLRGCPKEVGGNFYCNHNTRTFSSIFIRSICDVKGEINP